MKDSVRTFSRAFRLLSAVAVLTAGCGRSHKAADVAQDSILVRDADVSGNKTDTAGAATAALVRERGSAAQAPALTTGAPVTRPADLAGRGPSATLGTTPVRAPARTTTGQPTMQPPRTVNPSPVLPARGSTSDSPRGQVITSPTSPTPVTQPTPVAQPISPSPQPVTQPTPPPPTPKKDSSTDSLGARGN